MDNNDFLTDWGLTLMVFLPLAGALLMMLIPKGEEQLLKVVALGSSLASAAVGVAVMADFDYDDAGALQFVVEQGVDRGHQGQLLRRHRRAVAAARRPHPADHARCASSTAGTTSPSRTTRRRSSSSSSCCTPGCSAPSWPRT